MKKLGTKRKVDKEQYFTSSDLVKRCMDLIERHVDFNSCSLVVEPSAGDGSFYNAIPQGIAKIGLDIDPKCDGLVKANFFEWTPQDVQGRVIVIGNPPFGQRSSLAIRFIEHAATFADVIAFILPRSFNKYTFQNRVPVNFSLIDSFDCDEFYRVDGTPAKVNCVFQIWKKGSSIRQKIDMISDHPDLVMKHCHISRTSPEKLAQVVKEYPYSIPQVGGKFRIKSSSEVRSGSHWFIKPANDTSVVALQSMNFDFLKGMNTTFTSLSKRDIIHAYVDAMKQIS
jgi:hypothetical protein